MRVSCSLHAQSVACRADCPRAVLVCCVFLLQVRDDNLAFVQTCWTFINSDSLLTWAQKVGLDFHFAVEQRARSFLGHFFNFNGTAGARAILLLCLLSCRLSTSFAWRCRTQQHHSMHAHVCSSAPTAFDLNIMPHALHVLYHACGMSCMFRVPHACRISCAASGTGVWRIEAINDAGGWESDTVVEDMDLSLRVYLKGWRSIYLHDVKCPNELPSTLSAYKTQQFRWLSGPMQIVRKSFANIWFSK